jgi:hypothetical protein
VTRPLPLPGDAPALLPVPRCGCCWFWRRSKHQPYPFEARLHPTFEGAGSPWVEGWCGASTRATWESTYCLDWKPSTTAHAPGANANPLPLAAPARRMGSNPKEEP